MIHVDPWYLVAAVLVLGAALLLVVERRVRHDDPFNQPAADPASAPWRPGPSEPQIVRVPVVRDLETIFVAKRRIWARSYGQEHTVYLLNRWADRKVARARRNGRILVRPVEMAWSDQIATDWLEGRSRYLITYAWVDWPRAAGPIPDGIFGLADRQDHIELALEIHP